MGRPEVLASDLIRDRAYDLWDRHHRPEGYELHFWYMAERELRAERGAKVEAEVPSTESAPAYETLTA